MQRIRIADHLPIVRVRRASKRIEQEVTILHGAFDAGERQSLTKLQIEAAGITGQTWIACNCGGSTRQRWGIRIPSRSSCREKFRVKSQSASSILTICATRSVRDLNRDGHFISDTLPLFSLG
jgi:hypothetical protein